MRNQHIETASGEPVMTDHRAIRDWAESRNGTPAIEPSKDRGVAARLCIKFPQDASRSDVYEISWGEFFQRFEEAQLAMRVAGDGEHSVKFERRPGTDT